MNASVTDALKQYTADSLQVRWYKRLLHFKKPARTSRGDLCERATYIIELRCGESMGVGECCTMPGLLPMPTAEQMDYYCAQLQREGRIPADENMPSPLRFALETAMLRLMHHGQACWDNSFTRGEQGIRIHHLVWMDSIDNMLASMAEGIRRGFQCLKMKVGALPFDKELEMLREARKAFPFSEIRLDANGAFAPNEALNMLDALAECGIAYIEQPIAPGQWDDMRNICRYSPIPIALDEELIAHANRPESRQLLLSSINPQAIVIKPSLHGGFTAAEHWAQLAEDMQIDWWINSALESSIGLTALAEWCSYRAPFTMHGLGTGQLFTDDSPERISLQGESLYYLPNQ